MHEEWYARLESSIDKVLDPKEKLLAIFDYNIERQSYRNYGGCPFIKANDEAGLSDPCILIEIQQAKERHKRFIEKLVAVSGHKKLLSDQELATMIFLMVEGAVVSASICKQSDDLRSARAVIQKLI